MPETCSMIRSMVLECMWNVMASKPQTYHRLLGIWVDRWLDPYLTLHYWILKVPTGQAKHIMTSLIDVLSILFPVKIQYNCFGFPEVFDFKKILPKRSRHGSWLWHDWFTEITRLACCFGLQRGELCALQMASRDVFFHRRCHSWGGDLPGHYVVHCRLFATKLITAHVKKKPCVYCSVYTLLVHLEWNNGVLSKDTIRYLAGGTSYLSFTWHDLTCLLVSFRFYRGHSGWIMVVWWLLVDSLEFCISGFQIPNEPKKAANDETHEDPNPLLWLRLYNGLCIQVWICNPDGCLFVLVLSIESRQWTLL